MDPYRDTKQITELTARMLTQDLAVIGDITCVQRFDGWALLDDGVMFGFVDNTNKVYLRASESTALRFSSRGATKHADMPYWTVSALTQSDLDTLRDLAYEAADVAHMAVAGVVPELADLATGAFGAAVADRAHAFVPVLPHLDLRGSSILLDDNEVTLTLPRVRTS